MSALVILTVRDGFFRGQQYPFEFRTSCIIGRAEDCNIVLSQDREYSTISRYHCLLDINPPYISIRDLGSRHGTYINGNLIGKRDRSQTPEEGKQLNLPQYDLQDGDEIKLSNTTLRISIRSSPETAPTFKLIELDGSSLKPKTVEIEANKINFQDFIREFLQRADREESNLKPLQNHTLLQKLSSGSYGEVYLTRDRNNDELVALKVMLPQVAANQTKIEMFLQEIKKTQTLDHPNIVKFIDGCSADGIFFLTLEYLPEGTVNNLMEYRGGRLPITEAVEITLQILDALHYAHTTKNLVHRDIKPSNIFINLTKDGKTEAKLIEFGITKAFDAAGLSKSITDTGGQSNTLLFMPRQQVLNFQYLQPSVDVWATAATLYYMLTGFYPRNLLGDNLYLEALQSQPTPLRYRNASIPQPLADLIDLALNDNPILHFNNALAFKNALSGIVRSINL
jgi:hypothetical protein